VTGREVSNSVVRQIAVLRRDHHEPELRIWMSRDCAAELCKELGNVPRLTSLMGIPVILSEDYQTPHVELVRKRPSLR
jgi:hypothetical protein